MRSCEVVSYVVLGTKCHQVAYRPRAIIVGGNADLRFGDRIFKSWKESNSATKLPQALPDQLGSGWVSDLEQSKDDRHFGKTPSPIIYCGNADDVP